MSYDFRDSLRQTFYDLLESNLATEYGSVVNIMKENQKFNKKIVTPFVSTYMIFTSGRRASIGTVRKFDRHEGFFCIEVQVPEDTGIGAMWKLAGAVERVFFDRSMALEDGSYVVLETAKATGNSSQDGWYFITVMVPFCMDACN